MNVMTNEQRKYHLKQLHKHLELSKIQKTGGKVSAYLLFYEKLKRIQQYQDLHYRRQDMIEKYSEQIDMTNIEAIQFMLQEFKTDLINSSKSNFTTNILRSWYQFIFSIKKTKYCSI